MRIVYTEWMKTKYIVKLSTEERQELETLIRVGNVAARTQTRARILLLSDRSQAKPKTGNEIASALLCAMPTVTNIRRKFSEGGVPKALYDRRRPGQALKITGETEAHLLTLACSQPPEGRTPVGSSKCWPIS